MLMYIITVFRRVITLPVVSPGPISFGSAFAIVGDLGDRKEIGIGIRHGGRRLRVDGGAQDRFARVEVGGFAKPSGQEGMEVAAFFGGKAAFFIRCRLELVQS
jgi:hypothetical protein